ncbi:MAG TPA: FkbM family methyltransferase [Bacillales bacterium]|nr:FkbM family methyltransferase [Bacillales bacterium]
MCDIRGMAQRGTPQQDGGELVYVIALDQLWKQLCSTNEQISGVKIDVQGMELNVLRGMTSLLRKYRPKLAVEIHSGVNRNELLDLVKSAGYVPEGRPIEPLPGELEAQYYDDKSYEFVPI